MSRGVVLVNILGTEYEIIFENKDKPIEGKQELPMEYDGYIDFTSKRIYITDFSDGYYWEKMSQHVARTIRHEIVHAFLFESGLDQGWAGNEEVVDWIALQFPKMAEAFEELGV